jgi:hypothetical protein
MHSAGDTYTAVFLMVYLMIFLQLFNIYIDADLMITYEDIFLIKEERQARYG